MTILDSSAVLAILFREEDAPRFAAAIETAPTCRMSAANFLEAAIRVDPGGDAIASDAFAVGRPSGSPSGRRRRVGGAATRRLPPAACSTASELWTATLRG